MTPVALLSNPASTGNLAILQGVRSFCAAHDEIFHYEVDSVGQVGTALATIARVRPKVLVINGGDGTVQAALTELHHGGYFPDGAPPVAVLPNGKTNLIAHDLGADGDPLVALGRVLELARGDLSPHVVQRELIALSGPGHRPVLGMFLGGAGLADAILYCRNRIYPLGLPNGFAHVLTLAAFLLTVLTGARARFLPPRPPLLRVSVAQGSALQGRFQLLMVTTLEKLLLNAHNSAPQAPGALRLLAVERRPLAMVRALAAALTGKLGQSPVEGIHLASGDEIRIEGDRTSVVLDGELYEASVDRPIILTPTAPVSFLKLAA